MGTERDSEQNKPRGFAFFFNFVRSMVTSVFRNDENRENPVSFGQTSSSIDISDLFAKKPRENDDPRSVEALGAFDALFSPEIRRIFTDFMARTESDSGGGLAAAALGTEMANDEREAETTRTRIRSVFENLSAEDTERILNDTIENSGIEVYIAIEIARAAGERLRRISATGRDCSAGIALADGLGAKLGWLVASEERIVEYIIKGLERCGNPKARLKCLGSIEPYVSSKVSDPRLAAATSAFMSHLRSFYVTPEQTRPQPVVRQPDQTDDELPEFGNEEAELLASFGSTDEADEEAGDADAGYNADAADVAPERAGESPEEETGSESADYSDVSNSLASEDARRVKTETHRPVKNDRVKSLDAEIERISSIDEKIVTISFWIKNRYYDDDPECSEYLEAKLESLEAERARNGGLLADLFYGLRQIGDKKAQLEYLETKLNSPEYGHVRQTIATIIGNIRADIDFYSPAITEESLEKIVDEEEDLSKKLASLYAMRYDDALEPFREYVEERIEELESHKSAEIWEKLEDDYYGKATDIDSSDVDVSGSAFVTHQNIIALVRAVKKLPDKVERKKYIKEQEAAKPLPEDDIFCRQRRLLFHLMSAEIMDKPESMLKALADRVLLSFKDKKDLLEVLKKSRFNAGGKSITLQGELGITDEHIAYFATYIIGCELPFTEKRIKHITLFREGSLPLPQVTYKNASGEDAKANYRDFFAITYPVIDSVLEYFLKFVEGKKSEARKRVFEERRNNPAHAGEGPGESLADNDESPYTAPQDTETAYEADDAVIRGFESPEYASDTDAVTGFDYAANDEESNPSTEEIEGDFVTEIGTNDDESQESIGEFSAFAGEEAGEKETETKIPRQRQAGERRKEEPEDIPLDSIDSIVVERYKPDEREKRSTEPIPGHEPQDDTDTIESDERYTKNRISINATVLAQIKDKGAAESGKQAEYLKEETRKKIEEKAPITEQKISELLMRLGNCFPEAIPELISGSIIPIFAAKKEYVMRDVFNAFNQNIFIPVLHEGADVDVRKVIGTLQSFLNLASLATECEKSLLTIVKRLKKVRASYLRAQVKAISEKEERGKKPGGTASVKDAKTNDQEPEDRMQTVCSVLLGLDRNIDPILYLERTYISACPDTVEGKALRLKLTNMKSVLSSAKTIDWFKVTSYFGKSVSEAIALIKKRLGNEDSLLDSIDEYASEIRVDSGVAENADGGMEKRSPLKAGETVERIKEEKPNQGKERERKIAETGQKKPIEPDKKPQDTAAKARENKENAIPQKPQTVKPKETHVPREGRQQVQKKAQKKSFFEQLQSGAKKENPRPVQEQKKKQQARKTVPLGKRQSQFLANARELITEKLLFLIKEYSSPAMLDMLYKSYLGPQTRKKTMLALINQDKHKALYNAIAFDEHTIEMLGFDRQKVMAAFEKKKKKLMS